MLSRVANSIYWMSRYLERADNVARFIKVNSYLMLDLGLERANARWQPLVYASGDHEDFNTRFDHYSEKNVLHFLTFDVKNPNSILSCITAARENARSIRENIPSEAWEAVNELYHLTKKHSRKRRIHDLQEFYEKIQDMGHLITGFSEDMMAHREPWHFARMGRMLERGDKTARLIDIKYFFFSTTPQNNQAYDVVEWGAVLKSANASEMYRKQFHSYSYRNIAQFLIFDRNIPRSIAYCINAAASSLKRILGDGAEQVPAFREMEILQASITSTDVDQMLENGLHEFIDIFQYNLNLVDESIRHCFFAEV